MTGDNRVTIWFLCGIILLVYGLTIVGSAIYNFAHPPQVFAAGLHLDLWWGIGLTIVGALFLWRQWPSRRSS